VLALTVTESFFLYIYNYSLFDISICKNTSNNKLYHFPIKSNHCILIVIES